MAVQTKLYQRVYGAIMGFAVGDAFGVPFEEMHHRNILKQYGGIVREMLPVKPRLLGGERPYEQSNLAGTKAIMEKSRVADPFGSHSIEAGSYSDDTRYTLLCAKAIIYYGRRITSQEFALYLHDYVMRLSRERSADDLEFKWAQAMFSFDVITEIAKGSHVFSGLYEICTGWDGVAGIINPFDSRQAALDGGPMAAGVAEAMKSGATVDSVVGAVRDAYWSLPGSYCNAGVDFLQNSFVRRMDAALDQAAKTMDPENVINYLYKKSLITFPPYNFVFPLEMIPAACAILKACRGDYLETVAFCASFGRDCDGTAAMGGQLAATLCGAGVIPEDFINKVNKVSIEDIQEICSSLYKVIIKQLDAILDRVNEYRVLTK